MDYDMTRISYKRYSEVNLSGYVISNGSGIIWLAWIRKHRETSSIERLTPGMAFFFPNNGRLLRGGWLHRQCGIIGFGTCSTGESAIGILLGVSRYATGVGSTSTLGYGVWLGSVWVDRKFGSGCATFSRWL